MKVKRNDGSPIHHANATFVVRPGLGDAAGGVSFESTNFPGHFIRHSSFLLRLDKNDGSDLFKADATFYGLSGRDGSAIGIPAIMAGATPVAPAYPAYPGAAAVPGGYPGSPGGYPGAPAYPAPAIPAAAPTRPPDVTLRLRSQNFPSKHWRHYGKDVSGGCANSASDMASASSAAAPPVGPLSTSRVPTLGARRYCAVLCTVVCRRR